MNLQQQMLCGDEISSIVVDAGLHTFKFGTAGQESPKYFLRSSFAVTQPNEIDPIRSFDDFGFRNIPSTSNIFNLDKKSVNYFNDFESILNYGISNCMGLESSEYPLFLSQKNISQEEKNKLTEVCFEQLKSPALFIAPSSSLSSFCFGRRSSLVVDIGGSGMKISPIVDGYELKSSSLFSIRGGNYIDELVNEYLSKKKIGIRPWFDLKKTFKSASSSFRAYHSNEIVRDIKHWYCIVPPKIPPIPGYFPLPPAYELPDKTLVSPSEEISRIPELIYFPHKESLKPVNSASSNKKQKEPALGKKRVREILEDEDKRATFKGKKDDVVYHKLKNLNIDIDKESLSDLIYLIVSHCDVDIRKELLSNIILVGGGSLIDGISNRIVQDLQELVPSHMKIKLVSSVPIEKQFAPWIGGSILSICGSFHQMWITKGEYEEMGVDRVASHFNL